MKVKICGVKTEEAVKAASDAGVDFIGFMFAESKRKISVQRAAKLARLVPEQVKKVGVFVNPDLQELLDVIKKVGLDYVQLHGDESPLFCKQIPVPVIKAISIKERKDVEKARQFEVAYYLFDSPKGKYRGGSGITFNWELLLDSKIPREKIIVAGGLHPGNVQEVISLLNPKAVDVSSGVETNGEKDVQKIKAFIKQAKKKYKEENQHVEV
jgi:phosphoribosylanthranilate isomerase